MEHIHLIGIGGISMSGIAQILKEEGYKVTGSDINKNDLIDKLINLGIKIKIGHNQNNVEGADIVVYSNAIPRDNIELKYARKKNTKIMKRAEFIAYLMKYKKGIAISGTHGKTTTSAMVASLLKKGDRDPSVLLGGKLDFLDNNIGNAYNGSGDYFVTEADESDGSLLYFNPEIAIITNIELEHHDYYKNEKELLSVFEEFLQKVPDKGKIILWREDEYLSKLLKTNDFNVITYGLEKGIVQAKDINLLPFGSDFTISYGDRVLGKINLQVPGLYNIKNALASIAAGMEVGLSFNSIKSILGEFTGVKRRFEKKGVLKGALIIDDYAHHPTEIKETLKAAVNTDYKRLITVFQPHLYTRTQYLLDEFSRSFDFVDKLIVTDIYGAREAPREGINSKKLVNKIKNNSNTEVKYIKEFSQIVSYLKGILQPKDMLLTIGAGDVYKIGEKLLK